MDGLDEILENPLMKEGAGLRWYSISLCKSRTCIIHIYIIYIYHIIVNNIHGPHLNILYPARELRQGAFLGVDLLRQQL